MSDFHSQGIRWLFGVNILPRKAVLKGRGFKPRFFDNFMPGSLKSLLSFISSDI